MVRDGICGVSVDALKNCCSHFKLILCYFLLAKLEHYGVRGGALGLLESYLGGGPSMCTRASNDHQD